MQLLVWAYQLVCRNLLLSDDMRGIISATCEQMCQLLSILASHHVEGEFAPRKLVHYVVRTAHQFLTTHII